MKPFEMLSKRGQLQRLHHLGLSALAAYEVPEPRLVPLRHIENTTFRVLAADGQQYVLHIQRADSHAPETIRSDQQQTPCIPVEPKVISWATCNLLTLCATIPTSAKQ